MNSSYMKHSVGSEFHVGSQIHVKIESMFPSLVIWNETTHITKTYHAAVGELLHAYDRKAKNFVGTYCGSKDGRYSRHRLARLSLGTRLDINPSLLS